MSFIKNSVILLCIVGTMFVWGCGKGNAESDIQDVSLQLDFKRTDSLQYAAAKAFAQGDKPDTIAIFKQFLAQDKEFWAEMSPLYMRFQRDTTLTQSFKDSALALYYGRFLSDKHTLTLMDSIWKRLPSGTDFASRLTPLFKRVKKHFPDAQIPAVRTFINGYTPPGMMPEIDQTVPTVTGRYFGLGLQYWMGKSFPFYSPDIPQFIRNRFEPQFLEVMVANQIAEDIVPPINPAQNPTLLDKSIRLGIKQCVLDALIPTIADSMKLFYTDKQLYWADYYEKNIYKDVSEKLYSQDFTVQGDYIADKPFTSDLSRESAPRIGQYFGWKVVQSYLKNHPEVTIEQLAGRTDYEKIFKESKYKP